MNILGVSCFFHDAAACLVRNGRVIAAVGEERFSRIKQDARLPTEAIKYCLSQCEGKIDYVVFYERPFLKLERVMTWILLTAPKSYWVFRDMLFSWLKEKMWIRQLLAERTGVPQNRVLFIPHHLSHAASSFLCSPYNESAILTVDGVGEWSTAAISHGYRQKNGKLEIKILKEMRFPHSLGLLYSTFTAFLGFEVNEGEYKVMGMSAYGKPKYKKEIYRMVEINDDGSIVLDLSYFSFHYHRTRSYSTKFTQVFGKPRDPHKEYVVGSPPAQNYADIAASIQEVCEEVMIKMAAHARKLVPSENLCLAGGVALNSVANYKILTSGLFKQMYVQPAAGDAGGAVGAALYAANLLDIRSHRYTMTHAYLGREYSREEIKEFLLKNRLRAQEYKSEKSLIDFVVKKIVAQKVIGWTQGRFEWGPRALGNRSILADARSPKMKDIVNSKVKFRELFRPFAPSVLADRAHEVFDVPRKYLNEQPFSYMLLVVPVKKAKQKLVPAITHVNGTARPQFVYKNVNPRYYGLINEFYIRTGVPLILNTSFNLKGEPIVSTPQDAYSTFLRSHIDYLVMGNFVLDRFSLS